MRKALISARRCDMIICVDIISEKGKIDMKKRAFFGYSQIKPTGWLRRQLEIQAASLSGNLDKVWRDVGESKWIGGEREGWERLPYWLDGFIPLAYLLEDDELIARAKRNIDAIIGAQREDGWLCPVEAGKEAEYDTWALILVSKVLAVYYRASGDERVPDVLYRAMKNYHDLLAAGTIRLFEWARSRWFEAFVALDLLWEKYGEEWIRDLACILRDQGADYAAMTDEWKTPLRRWRHETHIVNMAMMLKYEAVSFELLGEGYTDLASRLYGVLDEYNGTAVGIITGDECLAGIMPNHGTELCAVVEQMYSLELLYAKTGEAKWGELLEKVAFNALPATFTDDMWAHQYDQLANQIACVDMGAYTHFTTNCGESVMFGLEPNYGCCTANFSQGFPKLAASAFLRGEREIHGALAIPCAVECELGRVELKTEYPFENSFVYDIEAKEDFALTIRVPSFALDLTVDGVAVENTGELRFELRAGERRSITVSWRCEARLVDRPRGMAAAQCGSIVYALPIEHSSKRIEYERGGQERKFPYCDYEFSPESEWRCGVVSVASAPEKARGDEYPFSSVSPRLRLKATVRPINWEYEYGYTTVCAAFPADPTPTGEAREVDLVPYGSTILRITEMPRIS